VDTAKRSATVSARIPADLEAALQQMALAENTSVSDLICGVLVQAVAVEQRRYLLLKSAFEQLPDLQGKSA
jgi:hypothetical protein